MERDELIRRAQRVNAAWNSHDPLNVAVLFSPECTTRENGQRPAQHGRQAIVRRAQTYFRAFVDFDTRLAAVNADGNVTFSRWIAVGTHTGPLGGIAPTGRRIEIEGCSVHEWDPHGYVQAETIYWDQAQMLRALGAIDPALLG
jgi:steroid delta-isomerase-like uncharacterized protein